MENILRELKQIRTKLYESIPGGFAGATIYADCIHDHLEELDEFIVKLQSDGNQANSENTNCAIFDVSQQRELLLAFADWQDTELEGRVPFDNSKDVDAFLKANNCG